MMKFIEIYLLLFLCSLFELCQQTESDIIDYFRMPKIYHFDDFIECSAENSLYCVANSYIKPDVKSSLYNSIKLYSSHKKVHLRHDKLQRGLCINKCEAKVQNQGNNSENYLVKAFPMDSKLVFDFIHYPNLEEYRLSYNDLINKCVNLELMGSFNLSAFSTIEYCVNQGDRQPLDSLEIFAAFLIFGIFVIVIFSSLHDSQLRKENSKFHDHYETELDLKSSRILTIFSLKRNWKILTAPTKSDANDLRFIESIRTFGLFGTMYSHCVMIGVMMPSLNPIFIDDNFSTLKSSSFGLFIGGMFAVQSFLVIGGFLTAYLQMKKMEKEKTSSISLFLKEVAGRYIRFASLLALTILVHSTWLYRFGSGPFWDRINLTERQFCRENGWTNLLFLDNYINSEHKCLIHSWYLATDFWLRILVTACIIVFYKKPSRIYWILSFIMGLSAVSMAYTIYVNKLEAIAIFTPEYLRNQFLTASDDETNYFADFYAPTHLNIGNYFIGVFAGLIYHKQKQSGMNLKDSVWLNIFWYCSFAYMFFSTPIILMFFKNDYEKPSIWMAFAGPILKNAWGLATASVMIGFIHRHGWVLYDLMSYSGYKIIGKISYATMICHFFIIKLLMTGSYHPTVLSDLNLLSFGIASYIISNILGLILTLSIDIPMTTICKMLNLK